MPQPTNALNVIPSLPPMTWRGIVAPPYDMANASGAHQQAERRFPYIDGASHDNVGRDPLQMPFKLYFLNSLRDGLFPSLFLSWRDAYILDGSSGTLMHPVFGDVLARPTTWSIELVSERTSGVVMDVTFVETFDDMPSDSQFAEITPLAELAAAGDAGMAALGIDWPTGERTTSLADLLKQVQGAVFSTRLTITGMANQALGTLDRIIDDLDDITDHKKWSVQSNVKELRNRVVDFKNKFAAKSRKTYLEEIVTDSTIDGLVRSHNTVADLIALNPTLMSRPIIRKGTTVMFFAE